MTVPRRELARVARLAVLIAALAGALVGAVLEVSRGRWDDSRTA